MYAITAACTSPTQTASVAPPAPKQRILAPEPAAAVPVQRAVREVEKIREGLTTEEVCRVLKQLVWASACPACCAVRKVILCVMCSALSRTFRVDANVCAEQVNTFTTAGTNSPSPIFFHECCTFLHKSTAAILYTIRARSPPLICARVAIKPCTYRRPSQIANYHERGNPRIPQPGIACTYRNCPGDM